MAETATASRSRRKRTYRKIFRQSGFGWQAYIAIFITEFILAATWASYYFINLYNIEYKTYKRDIFWPIILLLCSMKFFAPWFESWIQTYVRAHAIQVVNESEPNRITYKKAMKEYKLIKCRLMGWTWLFTIVMWAVWFGIAVMGLRDYYLVELALHIPLGLLAGAVSTFFRYLNKHIYWNHYSDEIYESISQMAKATCLIVYSLNFIKVVEFHIDLFWLRAQTACLIFNMFPMVLLVCSGNHFGRPPAGITRNTKVKKSLPAKLPTSPPILESSPPAQVTQTSGLPAESTSYDNSTMSSQQSENLPNTSNLTPDEDKNRRSLAVEAEVPKTPIRSAGQPSSQPGEESNDMEEGAWGIGHDNVDDIRVDEDSQCTYSLTQEEAVEKQRKVNRTRSGNSGQTIETPVRIPIRYKLDDTGVKKKKRELVADTSSSSPGASPVIIDINVPNQTVSYHPQGRESEGPRSTEPACQNLDVDLEQDVIETESETETSSSSCHTSRCNFFKCLCAETTEDESWRTSIPELLLDPPSSPRIFTPQVQIQDKRHLCVRGGRNGPRQLSGPHHPDPNRPCIDFEDPEPEPTQLEASGVHDLSQLKKDCEMSGALKNSVRGLIESLRLSFRMLWFWNAILFTALVNWTHVLFLVACPHLALKQRGEDIVAAGNTLALIAGPWLVVSIVLICPLKTLRTKPIDHEFVPLVYIIGLTLACLGMWMKAENYRTIEVPWVIFGFGYGVVANLKKTIHKYFFYEKKYFESHNDVKDMTRNVDCGIGSILILIHSIYYLICLYTNTEDMRQDRLAAIMGAWTFLIMIVCGLKAI